MTHSLTLNPWGGSRLPDIRQAEAAECGLACLAMIAGYHGRHMDLATLRRRHPVSVRGASLRSVMSMAAELDLAARPLRLEIEHLRELKTPAILHWDMDHFVVLRRVSPAWRRYPRPRHRHAALYLCGSRTALHRRRAGTDADTGVFAGLGTVPTTAEGHPDLATRRRTVRGAGVAAVSAAAGLCHCKSVLHADRDGRCCRAERP